MTYQLLSTVAGIVLSLLFSYVPGLKDKFNALAPDQKRGVMLILLLATAAGFLGVSCLGRYGGLTCDADGSWKALEVFILAAIANQAAFALTPRK